jgi:hypothetical protein
MMFNVVQDYANPLTRFAMQDYPEDLGFGMSQVYHGRKMLLDFPSPPAARIKRKVYFVGELSQDITGGYFIPERFFLASYSGSVLYPLNGMKEKTLYALGRTANRTAVSHVACFPVTVACDVPTDTIFRKVSL